MIHISLTVVGPLPGIHSLSMFQEPVLNQEPVNTRYTMVKRWGGPWENLGNTWFLYRRVSICLQPSLTFNLCTCQISLSWYSCWGIKENISKINCSSSLSLVFFLSFLTSYNFTTFLQVYWIKKNLNYLWCFWVLTLYCQLIANFLLILFWIKQLSHLHKYSKNLLMVLPPFNLFSSRKTHACLTARLIAPKPSPDHVTPVLKSQVGGGLRMGNTCTPMADSCQCMAKTTTIL